MSIKKINVDNKKLILYFFDMGRLKKNEEKALSVLVSTRVSKPDFKKFMLKIKKENKSLSSVLREIVQKYIMED